MKNFFEKADPVIVKIGFIGFMTIIAAQLGILFPVLILLLLCMIFNELISILENLIEMEMTQPGFLIALVDKFKHLIENQGSAAVDAVNVKDKENE